MTNKHLKRVCNDTKSRAASLVAYRPFWQTYHISFRHHGHSTVFNVLLIHLGLFMDFTKSLFVGSSNSKRSAAARNVHAIRERGSLETVELPEKSGVTSARRVWLQRRGQCCQTYDNYRICTIILTSVRCTVNNEKNPIMYDNFRILWHFKWWSL